MPSNYKPIMFLFNSMTNGGSYIPPKLQYFLLILSQIQMIFLSIECLLTQTTSYSHDFKYFSTKVSNGLTFYGTNDIDFKCVIIGLFLLLEILLTLKVAIFDSNKSDIRNKMWIKLMNTLHQIHFYIFWLPAFVTSLGLVENYSGSNKDGVIAVSAIAIAFNILLVILIAIYRSLSCIGNKLAVITDRYDVTRRVQGLVMTIFLVFSNKNSSDYFNTLKLGIIIILEMFSKGILVHSQPFFNFKSNIIANLTQTLSLTIVFNIILNAIINGSANIFSNNIIFGNMLFAPLILKAEHTILGNFRADVHLLKQTNQAFSKSSWTIHRLIYLRKLIKNGLSKDSGKDSQKRDLDRAAFLKDQVNIDVVAKATTPLKQRNIIFTELFRMIASKSRDPMIKYLLAQYLLEEFDMIIEPVGLLSEVLKSKGFRFSLQLSALEMQQMIRDAIVGKLQARKTKDIDIQHYLECTKVNEDFRKLLTSSITTSKDFYRVFGENHPSMRKFLEILSRRKNGHEQIRVFWEQKGLNYSREYKIMHLEFGLYNSIVKLDQDIARKHIKNYVNSQTEAMSNYEIDKICDKNIMDPNNTYFVISGEKKNLGTILEVSGNTQKLFGYLQDFLLGKNIELLMPNGLAGVHNDFFVSKFKDPNSQVSQLLGEVFAKDNTGYIKKVHLNTSLLSDISDGIKIWGVVRLSKDRGSYLIANEDGNIDAVTQDLGGELCIKPNEQVSLGKFNQDLDLVIKLMLKKDVSATLNSFSVKGKDVIGSVGTMIDCTKDKIEAEVAKILEEGKIISFKTSEYNRSQELKYHCVFFTKTYAGKKKILIKLAKKDESYKQSTKMNKIRSGQHVANSVNFLVKKVDADINESNEVTFVIDNHYVLPNPEENNKTLTVKAPSAAFAQSEILGDAETSSYDRDNFNLDIKERKKEKINYSSSSQQSKKTQVSRQRYTEAVPMLKFYKGRDLKFRFLILTIPFLMVLISMIILFVNSTEGINTVKNLLSLYSNFHNLDIYISSIAKTNFLLYILKVLGIYANFYFTFIVELDQYIRAVRSIELDISHLLTDLDASTKKMFFESDLRIYPEEYSLLENASHYGNLFHIIDDSLYKGAHLNQTLRGSSPDARTVTRYQNSLYANLNNDLLEKTDTIKVELERQTLGKLDEMIIQSDRQVIISSSVFGVCMLLFLIMLRKGNNDNINFLDSALNGKFTEDCHSQTLSLNSLQAAIESQDFTKVTRSERRSTKIDLKAKVKQNQSLINKKAFNDTTFKILLVMIFSGALVLIVVNFLILIVAERTFLDNVNKVPVLLNDIYFAGGLIKRVQVSLIALYGFIWRRDIYVRNKPSETAFDEELDALTNELKIISQELTYDFHMKMNEPFCNFIEINPNYRKCNTTLNGINNEGIEPFMNYFALQVRNIKNSVAMYPYLHPYTIYIATNTYSTETFESSYYYFAPAMTLLVNETSAKVIDTLDEGSKPVVTFIIIGIFITVLFIIYMVTIVYSQLITHRQNMCQILVMFPLKSILGSRALMEILINDSKEFYSILKKCAQTEEAEGVSPLNE